MSPPGGGTFPPPEAGFFVAVPSRFPIIKVIALRPREQAMNRKQSVSDALRDMIVSSGRSLNSLAHEVGVHQPTLWNFVNGRCGITLNTAEKLFAHFNLELVNPGVGPPTSSR